MIDLKFDIEKLKETKEYCVKLGTDLQTKRDELNAAIEKLRKDWNTEAGKSFFEKQDIDWEEQVNKYIEITGAVAELLQAAIDQYQNVYDEAEALKL